MRNLCFVLVMSLTFHVYGGTKVQKLKGKLVAPGECTNVQAGWTCYDKQSMMNLDQSQRRCIECEQELTGCIVYNAKQDEKIKEMMKEPPWYERRWVQLLGIGLFGVGLGVGITAAAK